MKNRLKKMRLKMRTLLQKKLEGMDAGSKSYTAPAGFAAILKGNFPEESWISSAAEPAPAAASKKADPGDGDAAADAAKKKKKKSKAKNPDDDFDAVLAEFNDLDVGGKKKKKK